MLKLSTESKNAQKYLSYILCITWTTSSAFFHMSAFLQHNRYTDQCPNAMKLKCCIEILSTVVTLVKVKAIQYHTRLTKSVLVNLILLHELDEVTFSG